MRRLGSRLQAGSYSRGGAVFGAVLGLTLLLAGCGFSMRGSADLPPELGTLHLEALDVNSDITRQMRRTLLTNGIEVVDTPTPGIHRLGLGREQSSERVLSVNANVRAGEYELTMSVPFQLRDDEGFVLGPETLSMDRVYLADPDNAVAKAEEAELIRAEMRRDLVVQILRRLQNLEL